MKEKDIKKAIKQRSVKLEDQDMIVQLEKGGRGGLSGLPLNEMGVDARALALGRKRDDAEARNFINKSRRRMIDPKDIVRASFVQEVERAPQHQVQAITRAD